MKKQVDYAKIKAMAQSILECIGDESEGENPKLPKQEQDINDGGQDELYKTPPLAAASAGDSDDSDPMGEDDGSADEDKKKRKISMMGQMLKAKMSKYA